MEREPWYVKAGQKYGIPTIIALILLWILKGDIAEIKASMFIHAKATMDSSIKLESVEMVLRQICINTSDDGYSKSQCFK